jgi:PAS domain S-box-containing protein
MTFGGDQTSSTGNGDPAAPEPEPSSKVTRVIEPLADIDSSVSVAPKLPSDNDASALRERFRLFFEHTPSAVAMVDRDMRYLLVSRRFLTDYAIADRDIIGRSHYDVFPEIPERWQEQHRRCLQGAIEECADDRLVRTDGSVDWVRRKIVPWHDAVGRIGGLMLFDEVITERKEAEQALRESYEEAKQARAEAEGARVQAEAANRMKDEFLALLGHELRNPLAPILTALQLMKIRENDASIRERTIIERQVQRLVSLVDDLLDVSRITRGKIELKKQTVEISQIITQAIEMASPLLEQRSHNLRISVPRRGLLLEADDVRLSQVVANLLTNAAKYTDPGGQIFVSAEAENDAIVVRVRDTGSGIAPEMLPHVFNMFVQGDRTLDRSQGGLGIGLTIVRSLVELHAGDVSAHSEGLGKGAEFVIRLPSLPQQMLDLSINAHDASASQAVKPRSHGRRVLVVDDNTDAAETLADILHELGHITSVAHDAPTALSKAAVFKPHVALLDIGLPVMDGYELARRLREQPEMRRVRLFAVTGYGQESDRIRSRAAGFHEHLVKPIDLATLQALIEKTPRGPG